MKYPKIPLAQTIIQLFKIKKIEHIVISPGSRNAPLTIGFTNDSSFNCYSIVDERCAAFFALGMSQQLGKPVAIVCTSGSALLNYYPAIAEAFYKSTKCFSKPYFVFCEFKARYKRNKWFFEIC
jgi:2-succinyl-5-enolpyruvyl-6-hydroxy-3-cyclohexene-1-carboxylate synthase